MLPLVAWSLCVVWRCQGERRSDRADWERSQECAELLGGRGRKAFGGPPCGQLSARRHDGTTARRQRSAAGGIVESAGRRIDESFQPSHQWSYCQPSCAFTGIGEFM